MTPLLAPHHYALLTQQLRGLRSTTITLPGGSFTWLFDFGAIIGRDDDDDLAWTATMSKFVWQRIVERETVTELDRSYLRLAGGWDRWLALLIRQVGPAATPQTVLKSRAAYRGKVERLNYNVIMARVQNNRLSIPSARGGSYTLHTDPA